MAGLALGRRFGKTTGAIHWLLLPALGVGTPDGKGLPVAWFAPNYRLLTEVWTEMKRRLKPVTLRVSAQEKRIELTTGGVIEFWSLDGDIVVRGRKYARIVIDEAAYVAGLEDAWIKAIRPTLADFVGDAFFLSTPNGLNYFYALFGKGQDPLEPSWKSWQLPTHLNPYIPPDEIEAMRLGMTEKAYQQEIMAQFIADGTGVFRYVRDAAHEQLPEEPVPGRAYAIGVDWGRTNDFTVFAVMDIVNRKLVHIERSNQLEYAIQSLRLVALCERYKPAAIVVEENSIGAPIIEQLRRMKLYITPFVTTNATKMRIIDNLALHFERKIIKILPDPTLVNELIAFDQTRLPSGMIRFSAPEGQHDDMVMALALAVEACGSVDGYVDYLKNRVAQIEAEKEQKKLASLVAGGEGGVFASFR